MRATLRTITATALLLAALTACREVPSDRLYALRLEKAPTTEEWERALPRLVTVRGGRLNEPRPAVDIDDDTVHTSTASCHHGAAPPEPVVVDMRAFYTDETLYIRLSWDDATRDDAIRQWHFDGENWQSDGALEDGIGLLWDAEGRFPRFSCSYACHIDDFGVAGASFHARNSMRLAAEGRWLDLWNWKARRTGRYGFADDRFVDHEGMHGDVPGELFRANSRAAAEKGEGDDPFGPGDRPVVDETGLEVAPGFRLPGSRAPGYLTDLPVGGRADVAASSEYVDGRWTVILRRSLRTGDPHDAVFLPGDEAGIAFGLALMDNTLNEHYASATEERLVLLPPSAERLRFRR